MKDNILIVEDNYIVAYELQLLLQSQGYNNVNISSYGEEAFDIAQDTKQAPNLYIMDVGLKGEMDGIEAATAIKELNANAKFIFVSGQEEGVSVPASISPVFALAKPIDNEELLNMVDMALPKSPSFIT